MHFVIRLKKKIDGEDRKDLEVNYRFQFVLLSWLTSEQTPS